MPKPNYHKRKFFTENSFAIEMIKTQILMNKPVYLGLSILDLKKTILYELLYDYLKPKYGQNLKLCYIDIGSFVVPAKTDDF